MYKIWTIMALALTALLVASAALADDGHGDRDGKRGDRNAKATSVVVTRVDNGSCGRQWATDTVKSEFKVRRNDDGSFRLTRKDRGTFVTTGPESPGKCETGSRHGTAVVPGVRGKVHGFIRGTVTGGTFNPAGCTAVGADCSTTPGTIAALFGPNATFSCRTDSKDCKFDYEYSAPDEGNPTLLFHHWTDKGKGAGSMLVEKMRGDIATS